MRSFTWTVPAMTVAGVLVVALAQSVTPNIIATVPLWFEGQLRAGWVDMGASDQQLSLLPTTGASNNRVPSFLCGQLPTSWKANVWQDNVWQNADVQKLELKLLQGNTPVTLAIERHATGLKWQFGPDEYSCSTSALALPAEFAAALYSVAPMSADGKPARWSSLKFP